MSEIMERAGELATRNTPGVALSSFGILLENLFLGFFACVAWVLGRLWFHGSKLLYAVGLAFADGYKRGAMIPDKAPEALPPPPSAPRQPGPADLMKDNPIRDAYMTPFGVPHGPNVQSWSEPG